MRRFFPIYFYLLTFVLLAILIASWIGSAYDSRICNLLDVDGIRWGLKHVLSNFEDLPLAFLIFVLITLSVVIESGWADWLLPKNHPLMLRQLRAHTYTNLVLTICVIGFLLVLFFPGSPFLNAFGGLEHSPIAQGWLPLLLLLIILLANVYGYLSGQLSTASDFIYAHTKLLSRYSFTFISLFIVAQIVGCLNYSNLLFFAPAYVNKLFMYVLIIFSFIR